MDFELPSPKRLRAESPQISASPRDSEAADDFDDIYNTPPHISEDQSTEKISLLPPSFTPPEPMLTATAIPGLGRSETGVKEPRRGESVPAARLAEPVEQSEDLHKMEGEMPTGAAKTYTEQKVQDVDMEYETTKDGAAQKVQAGHKDAVTIKSIQSTKIEAKVSEEPLASLDGSLVSPASKVDSEQNARPDQNIGQIEGLITMSDAAVPNAQPVSVSTGGETANPAIQSESADHTKNSGISRIDAEGDLPKSQVQLESEINGDHEGRSTFEEVVEDNKTNPEAEFELDSSPLTSSSDSSTDSSSDDDSDEDEAYPLLSPEELARRLTAEDGDSDEDTHGNGQPSRGLRTQNEKVDEDVPKVDIIVTDDMKREELGFVDNLVENVLVIKAKISGEYQVLETGSVLCLEDRTVIGVVSETLGRVEQPYYSVRFPSSAAIAQAGINKGTKVFYVVEHSTTVFTQALKGKGSDASNIHDEEVADDELEFSDDEAEAEHRKRVRMQRQARRGERDEHNDGFSKGPRGRMGPHHKRAMTGKRGSLHPVPEYTHTGATTLNYDERTQTTPDTEDLYTPLIRPTNLHEIMGHQEAPVEDRTGWNPDKGRHHRGRNDRGGFRGRNRGGRGRGAPRPMHEGPSTYSSTSPYPSSSRPSPHSPPSSLPPRPNVSSNGFPPALISPSIPSPYTAPTSPPAPTNHSASYPYSPQPVYQGHPFLSPYASATQPPPPLPPPPQQQQQQTTTYTTGPPPAPAFNPGYSHNPYQQPQQPQQPGQAYSYTPTGHPFPAMESAVSAPLIPAGAHVNPSFFRQQHQHQHQHQQAYQHQQPQSGPSWYPNGSGGSNRS